MTKPEARPLLVTSVHPTNKKAPFVAHCISTRKQNSPSDPVVEMPWDPITGAGVGLYEWCAVVLKWMAIVDPRDVEDVSGKVEPEFLNKVLTLIAESR